MLQLHCITLPPPLDKQKLCLLQRLGQQALSFVLGTARGPTGPGSLQLIETPNIASRRGIATQLRA